MAVFVGVMLGGLLGMMLGMEVMAMGDMRVVTGFMMVPCFVVVGGRAMVPGGVFVVLGSFAMVLRTAMF